jgi:tubby-related protein 1
MSQGNFWDDLDWQNPGGVPNAAAADPFASLAQGNMAGSAPAANPFSNGGPGMSNHGAGYGNGMANTSVRQPQQQYNANVNAMFDNAFAGIGQAPAPAPAPSNIAAEDLDWLFDGPNSAPKELRKASFKKPGSFRSPAVAAAAARSFRRQEKEAQKTSLGDVGAAVDSDSEYTEYSDEEDDGGSSSDSGPQPRTRAEARIMSEKTKSFRVVAPKSGGLHTTMSFASRMPRFDMSNPNTLRRFLTAPVPRELGTVRCFLKRGLDSSNKYIYALYLDRRKGNKFVMFAKDRSGFMTRGVNVMISMTPQGGRHEPSFIGKVRGNMANTEFVLYDNGLAPRKARGPMEARAELAHVRYTVSSKHPRVMDTLVPAVDGGTPVQFRPMRDEDGIEATYQKEKSHGGGVARRRVVSLPNKEPEWDEKRQCHTLDFRGRAKMSSVKNFILYDSKDGRKKEWLLSGKIKDNHFSCDVTYPLSILQGFGIALSAMYARHDTFL